MIGNDLYTEDNLAAADKLATELCHYVVDKEDSITITYLALIIALSRMHTLIGKVAPEVLPADLYATLNTIAQFLETFDEPRH